MQLLAGIETQSIALHTGRFIVSLALGLLQAAKWIGSPSKKTGARQFFQRVKIRELDVSLGAIVQLHVEEDGKKPSLGLVHCLWETSSGEMKVQLRVMCKGDMTVLGDAASTEELFLTENFIRRCAIHIFSAWVASFCWDIVVPFMCHSPVDYLHHFALGQWEPFVKY